MHPAGLLSARAAGGDPARPPVSHQGVPAKPEKGPSAWVREKLGTHGCLHGLVPKTKKKESEIFLGSTSDSQMPGAGPPTSRKLPPWGSHVLCLEGGPNGSPPAECPGRESQDLLAVPVDSTVMGSPFSPLLCEGWGELEAKNSSESLRVEAAGSFLVSCSPLRVCS